MKKKIPVTSDLVTTPVFIIKISEFQRKGPNTSRLVTATVVNLRIQFLMILNILLLKNLIS